MTEEAVKPESTYSPHFTFKTFAVDTDPHNEERIFALRYQVYCLEPVSYTHLTLPTNREV